jgi:hypothetical protein
VSERYFGEPKPALADLAHHGVKGMHWGDRKGPSSSEIHSARSRNNDRMASLDDKARRLSMAKTTGEKQSLLRDIHSISKEGIDSKDHETAAHLTGGEKLASSLLGGPIGAVRANSRVKSQGQDAAKLLQAYHGSKLSDYH